MRRVVLLCLVLALGCSVCHAEIPCVCLQEPCRCFIQLGDGGPEMEYIQHALIAQGYLNAKQDASLFDEHTLQAVLRFQQAHGLPETGVMDDETLTLLLWGKLPQELDEENPLSNGNPVWIPTDGGVRRHVKPTCSRMHDPRRVSVRNAAMMDMQPCGRCNKGGKNE